MQATLPATDEQTFRQVMGHFPTGVITLTAEKDGQRSAMTLQSFQSLSLDPQLILVSVAKTSTSWPAIREIGNFAITILAEHQSHIARGFSRRGSDKFAEVDTVPSPTLGHPVPIDAVATMDCTITAIHDGGDHDIIVAAVHTLELNEHQRSPLVFFASQFSAVATQKDHS